MPAPPKPRINWHEEIEKFLRSVKPSLKDGDKIILTYSIYNPPFARLRANLNVYNVPIPVDPGRFGSWKEWFYRYLEPQISIIARDVGVNVYLQGKNKLLELNTSTDYD